jgi:hypothetical protein
VAAIVRFDRAQGDNILPIAGDDNGLSAFGPFDKFFEPFSCLLHGNAHASSSRFLLINMHLAA